MRHVQPSPTHLRSRAQNPCLHRYHADSFTATLGDLIFPGARHNPTRDNLPAFVHALRRTSKQLLRTIARYQTISQPCSWVMFRRGYRMPLAALGAGVTAGDCWGASKISRKIVSLLGT